jgi:hypothetical protein
MKAYILEDRILVENFTDAKLLDNALLCVLADLQTRGARYECLRDSVRSAMVLHSSLPPKPLEPYGVEWTEEKI